HLITPSGHVEILTHLLWIISGQIISDKHSEVESKLDFVKRTLRWRHLTSTAPYTLGCYSFTDIDTSLI
ncbi:unnamed protein product, partial [Brassica rapa]